MKYTKIKSCNASLFISNLQEIANYYTARKKITVITNTNRLINIIKVYFETLIYYLENSPSKFIVNIEQNKYQAMIYGQTETGDNVSLDLDDISDQLIKDVIYDLAKTINPAIFGKIAQLLNSIILTPKIASKYKISVITGENNLPQGSWYTLARQLPEKLALETIDIRIDFIFQIIKSPKKPIPNIQNRSENLLSLHSAYELYIKTLLRIHIYNNHYEETNFTIISKLEELIKLSDSEYLDKKRLVCFLLSQLVLNNNLFQIERKDSLREIIEEYREYIDENILSQLYEGVNFNPENFEFKKFCSELVEPDFSGENLDDIKTVISFVVPFVADKNIITCELDDRAKITFSKITNVFEDPIYSFLDSAEMSIKGLPMTFFADSIGNINGSTKIDIVINQFYHPDFELIANKITPIDLEREEARRGGRYFPHKDQILELLWELQRDEKFPFQIKSLNSDFISNYLVSYFSTDGKPIHHKLFTITNFNSYFEAKNKFINNLNQHYMYKDIPEIRAYILDTKINSKKSFSDFCYRLLEISLKKSIEFGGLNIAFWKDQDTEKVPISEPNSQPIIYNQIRFLAEIKGIRISREVIASNGSLDFHFSYTKNDVLMNVCVELKNAHHPDLEHGITTQLPLYINDVGSKEGIFLVLWYKSAKFKKPSAFNDIKELKKFLFEKSPKEYRIQSLIIDCSPKASPSLKSSRKRLNNK